MILLDTRHVSVRNSTNKQTKRKKSDDKKSDDNRPSHGQSKETDSTQQTERDRQHTAERDGETDSTQLTDRQRDRHHTDGQTDLFGELLLAQFVQREELLGKVNIPDEAASSKFHPDNDLTIRHHHGHCAEHDLQVFW